MKDEIKLAKSILKKYGRKLEPSWAGVANVWHAWHEPHMVWIMTYKEYINRIIQIEQNKPTNEKPVRFKFFKPVKGKFKKSKADADRKKAYADWEKAYAYSVKKLHDKECPNCPWDEKTTQLIFKK